MNGKVQKCRRDNIVGNVLEKCIVVVGSKIANAKGTDCLMLPG